MGFAKYSEDNENIFNERLADKGKNWRQEDSQENFYPFQEEEEILSEPEKQDNIAEHSVLKHRIIPLASAAALLLWIISRLLH